MLRADQRLFCGLTFQVADDVKTMMQVATIMAHQDNQDAAKFLIHVARRLAKQLELYPQLDTPGVRDRIDCD